MHKGICIGSLICFYLAVIPSGSSQVSTYDLGLPGLYFMNMIRHNDTLAVSGIITRGDTFAVQDMILIRLDTSGVILDYFIYHDSLDADYAILFGGKTHGMLKCLDNSGYILHGHAAQRGNAVIMKIGNDGRQLWVEEYPDPFRLTEVYSTIVDVGNGYLVAGRKQALNYLSDIFVMKIDLQGNKVWEKKYGEDNGIGDYFEAMVVLNTNEIVVAGSTSGGDVPFDERRFINKIFAIDTTGKLKWSWESEPSLDQTVRGLNRDDNGNWCYATLYLDYISEFSFKVMPKFVKRDSAFNLLAETELDDADAFYNYFLNMIPLADGGYLGTGINYESGEPHGHSYAWLIKLNADGEVIWERKDLALPDESQVSSTQQYLHSAVELPGGNIIASGSYKGNLNRYGLLIKVDKDGCIDTLCTTTSLLEHILNQEALIKVYPNPAIDHIVFELPEDIRSVYAEIFDLTGRMIMRKPMISGTNEILLDKNMSLGTYAWKVLDTYGRMIGSGKIIITNE